MNKRISLGAAIAFMLIVATAVFAMTMVYATNTFNKNMASVMDRKAQFDKLSEIDTRVRQNYSGTINETTLMDSIAQGYLEGIGDSYATYINARANERLRRQAEGNIAGIGAVFSSNTGDGYLVVEQVYPDSPAQAEGLLAGDVIVQIDDIDLTPENSGSMLYSIQGESGTQITLKVRRGTEETIMQLQRRPVVVPSVHGQMMPDSDVGYIWIEEFNDNTSEQFNQEIRRLNGLGANVYIFDLRDNKGGVLRQAVRMLDRLLPDEPYNVLASYTHTDGTVQVFTSDANELEKPMVVIVNGNTASAAELFAQALKDFDRASIVGTNTAGKWEIQQTYDISDGSAISITVAELLPPSGESHNGVGVKPDYEVSMGPEQNWRSLEYGEVDAQLVKALEVAVALERTGAAPIEQPSSSEEEISQSSSEPEESAGSESSEEDESSGEEGDESSQEGDESSEDASDSSEEDE